MQQGQFGVEFNLYLLFYNFSLFSEIFISIDEYANQIINLYIMPFHPMKVLYLSFNLLASLIVQGELLMRHKSFCRYRPTFFIFPLTPSPS